MTWLAAFAPLLTLIIIGALQWGYFRRHAGRDTQQYIALADLSYRTVRGAARFAGPGEGRRTAGVFDLIDAGGDARGVDPELFDPASARIAAALGGRLVLDGDTVLEGDRYIDTLICTGDLIVRGDCAFLSPVKVSGDLIVEGNAAFLKPLTVGGHARIAGLATLQSGMVAKGELAVDGTMIVGTREREGWLAAGAFDARGRVLLNGHIDTIEPPAVRAAEGDKRPNAMIAIVIAAIGYFLSIPLGGWALGRIGVTCQAGLTVLDCAYPQHAIAPWSAIAFASGAAAILVSARLWLRDTIAYPFVATMSVFAVLAALYDAIAAAPILREARIVSDTMNVLGFVMLASFLLIMAVLRRSHMPLGRVVIAVAVSFGAKTIAMLAFALLRGAVMGATELMMLFVVYAFGAFATHLMAMTALIKHVRLAPPGAGRAASAGASGRASAVDGMRGLAILMVVIYHYVPTQFFSFNLGKPINSILFVVAGFFFATLTLKQAAALDGGRIERARTLAGLLIRRHIRIWPPLAIVVGLYLGLSLIDHGPLTQQIRATWPYYLTYSGYLPRWAYEGGAFPAHLWVISAQETLLAGLCLAIGVFGLARFRRAVWMLVVAGVAARLAGTWLFMPAHPALALESPFAVFDPLALGMLARYGLERTTARSRLRRRVLLTLVAAIGAWAFLPNWNTSYFTLAPLISGLVTALVMVLSADQVRGRRLGRAGLGAPWLVFLGKISLPLFLLHPLVNTLLRLGFTKMTGIEMPWMLLFAIGPALSIAAAWTFGRIVEEPLRALSGRVRLGLTPPRTVSAPATHSPPMPEALRRARALAIAEAPAFPVRLAA